MRKELVIIFVIFIQYSVQTQSILYEENFSDRCVCSAIFDMESTLPQGWSIDDGTTEGYIDGSAEGTRDFFGIASSARLNSGVYTCDDYNNGNGLNSNYPFSGKSLHITGYHNTNTSSIIRNSIKTSVLSPVYFTDDCRHQDIRLELKWELISKANSSAKFDIDIWFGGELGQWVNIFTALGNTDSGDDDSSPLITNGECTGCAFNGTNTDPERLCIDCYTGASQGFNGPFRLRFTYTNPNNSGNEGVIIDDVKIVADQSIPSCHPDYDALRALYISTSGEEWTERSGWSILAGGGYDCSECDVCSWEGIICNNAGRVIRVELPFNNLSGYLPTELGKLKYLEALSLFENNISGEIPGSIFSIVPLFELNLNTNKLTGEFPEEMTNAKKLDALLAANNQLNGVLPDNIENMTDLRILNLADNSIKSPTFFACLPATIGHLSKLEELVLRDNALSGCIPVSAELLCQNNVFVDLTGNPIHNNFNDFCQTGVGICTGCADDMGLSSVWEQHISWYINKIITSTGGALQGSNLAYYAGESICLEPGFFVESESVFMAEIDDCPVVNDNSTCNSAIPIAISSAITYNSAGPTNNGGCHNCSESAEHAVWYKFDPEINQTIDISSCNSGKDTRLWVYEGTCNNLVQVAQSDDECSSSFASEILNISVSASKTYYLEWDNRWNDEGFFFTIR